MADMKLELKEGALAAGVSTVTGNRYELRLATKDPDDKGEIHVLLRGHDGHQPVRGEDYRLDGAHGVNYQGKTGGDGAIHHPARIPIDTYALHVCGQNFTVAAQPASSSPQLVRVPGWPRQDPPASDHIGPPPRTGSATGGRQILAALTAKKIDQITGGTAGVKLRDDAFFEEMKRGNVPDFCRHFVDVHVEDDQGNTGIVRVIPDCVAIGTNEDYIRVNLSGYTSQRIADEWKCKLPTMKLVLAAYDQAAHKMVYHNLDPSLSNRSMVKHEDVVQGVTSCGGHGGRCGLSNPHPGDLVCGHKKEVILSYLLAQPGERLAIYGFFDAKGVPAHAFIASRHQNGFTDYSQGTRLVHPRMLVNGQTMAYEDVLKSSKYHRLLIHTGLKTPRIDTDQGPYTIVRFPPPPTGPWPGGS